jgi:hypothetical protein
MIVDVQILGLFTISKLKGKSGNSCGFSNYRVDRSVKCFPLCQNVSSPLIIFLEFASVIGLLLYSIWSGLWLSIKALVV